MPLLARCPRCKNTFEVVEPGVTACPHCAAQVFVPAPEAAPGEAAPEAAAEEVRPAPFDERARLGFFPALGRTIKLALLEPGTLFDRLDPKPLSSGLIYGLIVNTLGAALGGLISYLTTDPEQTQKAMEQLGQAGVSLPGWIEEMLQPEKLRAYVLSQIVAAPIYALVSMVLVAGWTHLLLRLFSRPRHSFETSLRVVGFASTPALLAVIPSCGAAVGTVWMLFLVVFGISRVQKVGMGAVTAAVITPPLLLCCGGTVLAVVAIAALARGG